MHAQPLDMHLPPEELLRYMPRVQHQRQELRLIEAAWDNLSLLASLSTLSAKASSGGDLAQARNDFAALSQEMMRGLASEALKTALEDLGSRAQVCIDIMVRNLFERTADIGFFATDVVVADYLAQPDTEGRGAMEKRLREYADKYTVYDNILLFDMSAQLRACLKAPAAHDAATDSADAAFLAAVASSQVAYTEHYGIHGFCGGTHPSLVYAQPVGQGGKTNGVLCLEFKLADEGDAIFSQVLGEQAQDLSIVLALVDAQGRVIHSSDVLQLPLDWQVSRAAAAGTFTLRHLGRKYLAVVRDTHGFQGYAGPGWRGLALLPLDGAFDQEADTDGSVLVDEVARNPHFLSGELSAIPRRSAAIQSALERSVWNGLLELNHQAADGSETSARDTLFAKTLLSEIGATAKKTANAFASTLQDLHKVVMRSMLRDAQSRADLAMQILDRNLYERANDCRWWALTPQFVETLKARTEACPSATAVLQHINSLYTVYACLVLFDGQGKVLAVSQPGQAHHIGETLDEPWVASALRLRTSQDYTVSSYAPSRFYTDESTFVYAAAIRDPQARNGTALGGIGIVWDATGQMQSILDDCAGGMGERDLLAFVDSAGRRLHGVGTDQLRATPPVATGVADLNGRLHGVGLARGSGYREFGTSDGYDHGLRCQALRYLCERQSHRLAAPVVAARQALRIPAEHLLQLATFSIAGHWLGVNAELIIKAEPDSLVVGGSSARAPLMGFSRIGDKVYPVIDMHSACGDAPAQAANGVDPTRQMLVLRLPSAAGKVGECVLRVDSLGSLLEVDARQLQVLNMSGEGKSLAMVDAVVSISTSGTANRDKTAMLSRISQTWLWHYANGDPVPRGIDIEGLNAAFEGAAS